MKDGFSNWLDKSRDRLMSIIPPKTISVDRFIDGVICVFTYGRNKDALLRCDQNNIMRAIEKAAEYGLKVNEDGQFLYFTAYKDTCSVILTGRGELALAYRTGKIHDASKCVASCRRRVITRQGLQLLTQV